MELFLAGKIGFMETGDAIRDGLNGHVNITNPELDDIITACRDANGRVVGLVGA